MIKKFSRAEWSHESVLGGRRSEEMPSPAAKIIQINPARLRSGRQSRCQIQGLIDERRLRRGRLLTHVAQDRHFGPRGNDGIFDSLDPHPRPVAVSSFVPDQRLQGEDAV